MVNEVAEMPVTGSSNTTENTTDVELTGPDGEVTVAFGLTRSRVIDDDVATAVGPVVAPVTAFVARFRITAPSLQPETTTTYDEVAPETLLTKQPAAVPEMVKSVESRPNTFWLKPRLKVAFIELLIAVVGAKVVTVGA
jgi:hypothetical protein